MKQKSLIKDTSLFKSIGSDLTKEETHPILVINKDGCTPNVEIEVWQLTDACQIMVA